MQTNLAPPRNRGVFEAKFGYHPAMPNTGADIAPFGDMYWPDSVVAAADIDIASSSVQDKGVPTAGSGAQAILIKGIDANYLEIEETVILNGQTDVHPTKDYLRIYRVEVVKKAGAGAINAGNIIIDINGSNTMAQILTSFGQTTQAGYTIPANYKTGWLMGFDVGMIALASGKFAQGQLLIRAPNDIWLVKHVFGITSDKDHEHHYQMNLEISQKYDLRLRIFAASASNLFISGTMDIYLET